MGVFHELKQKSASAFEFPPGMLCTHSALASCALDTNIYFFMGLCPKTKKEWNKWKKHFHEMKGDVGCQVMKKKGNKKMPSPRHKLIHNPIPTSLPILCRNLYISVYCDFFVLYNVFSLRYNKYSNSSEHNKDVGMGLGMEL